MRQYLQNAVFLATLLLCSLATKGQELPAVALPVSPTTAALEKYATMPVSENTGTPTVSIPLFEIKSRQLSLPISLSYHASGVRVSEDASWVGLGWSLNAGGMVSRTVRGLPDEDGTRGFLVNRTTIPDANQVSSIKDYDLLKAIADGRLDYEPDMFYYNYPGGTGQFQFGNDGKPYSIPFQPIRIVPQLGIGKDQVEITAVSGEVYRFADMESTSIEQRGPNTPWQHSAWYLSQIISADKSDTIYFDYARHVVNYTTTTSQQQSLSMYTLVSDRIPTNPPPGGVISVKTNVIARAVKLRRIRFATGSVEFVMDSTGRNDLLTDRRLTSIILYSSLGQQNREVKRFDLQQSYFENKIKRSPQGRMNYRLRLDALVEKSGSITKPPHCFSYSPIQLPPSDSFSQDHWGYFNNKANTNLIPEKKFSTLYTREVKLGLANREPDSAYTQAGALRKIHYPTGGHTELIYESNTVPVTYQLPRKKYDRNIWVQGHSDKVKLDTLSFVYKGCPTLAQIKLQIQTVNTTVQYPHTAGLASFSDITNGVTIPLKKFTITADATVFDSTYLEPGHKYLLIATATNPSMQSGVTISWEGMCEPPEYVTRNTVWGGIRVRRIISRAKSGAPDLLKKYTYSQPSSSASSGYVTGLPLQYDTYKEIRIAIGGDGEIGDGHVDALLYPDAGTEITMSSSPVGSSGSEPQPVAYSSVTVYDGISNGKTESLYSVSTDSGSTELPVSPVISAGWQRGQLLARRIYRTNEASAYELVTQEKNYYGIDDRNRIKIRGFKAAPQVVIKGNYGIQPGDGVFYASFYATQNYYQPSVWQHLDSTVTIHYAPTDTTTGYKTAIHYQYANPIHAQPTQTRTIHNPGDATITYTKYPLDYSTTNSNSYPALGITALAENHQWNPIIEQIQLRTNGKQTGVVSGKLIGYSQLRPVQIAHAEFSKPVALPDFAVSAITSNGSLTRDPHYRDKLVIDRYDTYGNILQQHKLHDTPTAYLWGYKAARLIAEIKNASYEEVIKQLAAQGTPLESLRTDEQIKAAMEQLRHQLPQALVTSFTHSPTAAISSITDSSGRTITYEYDELGRLVRTRNDQGHILAEQQYQYARP